MTQLTKPIRRYLPVLLGVVMVGWFLAESLKTERSLPSDRTAVASAAAVNRKDGPAGGIKLDALPEVTHGPERRTLFTSAHVGDTTALDAALPAPSRAVRYGRVNRALFSGKPSPFWQPPGEGRIELPLPDGGRWVVVIEGSEMLGPDRFVSVGRIDGRPLSRALLAWNGGFLHASVEDPVLGVLVLRAATEELSQVYLVDPALVAPCGGERRPARAAGPHSVAPEAVPPSAAVENPQRAEVHVLMVYTQAVLTTLSGAARTAALQSAFDLAIAKVNATLEASLVSARLQLVGIAETAYDEDASTSSKVQDDALTALYRTDDGRMDEIHAVRDAVGADLVCLTLGRRDSGTSGLSFLLDEPHSNVNAEFAFTVVQYSLMAGTNVLAHELGHLFGCAHDRENALSGAGAYSFSYGYRFFGADGRQYRDIMSYAPGIELGYFSNPDVIVPAPVNMPIGIPAGRPGEANSALTIERNAFAAAVFRLQTQRPAGAGLLINVATRAFVGTDDEVLIGGFVVDGAGPMDLLVRATGPALAAFGVGNTLADPVLRLYAGGTVVAENDNWMQRMGPAGALAAGDVAAAAARVRAFPLAAGSADAAVLVTLPPGAYSAVMEGARGTTGFGLIEAYDAGGDGTRILGLATRGFADRTGKEMYGGFVVRGDAGTTKRVLIRVLGPSLARAPFNMAGALDDPEMEVRNAAGETLVYNDDWSTGAEGGASAENDFKPLVRTYGEKWIFATGHAPRNRREPCVLVDLPPGAYTVIVRPFELRSSNPALDQPARPGVGVVEVYEIR